MSESVSGVDAILTGLRASAFHGTYVAAPGSHKPLAVDWCVRAADAEAAIHATVREIETWLREECPAVICNSDAANQVARRFGGGRNE